MPKTRPDAPSIPIQNIYYLLIYAWDRLAEGDLVDVSGIDSTELVDLYAAVLLGGLRHLARRGLDRRYLEEEIELAGIRGRALVASSARRMLGPRGRAVCVVDDLSVDTLENQIILATVTRLIGSPALNDRLREQLTDLNGSLHGISRIRLSRQAFRAVQLHGNNGFYKFLLNVCELILETSLSTEDEGRYRFRDFVRDPSRMAMLFEKFVLNFYRRERRDADVRRERIYWAAGSADDPALQFLPTMQTDISFRTAGRTQIIDAKYYRDSLQTNFGSETVHSGNLYQMFSYLKNLAARGGQDATAEGMLLYPEVGRSLRLTYELSGHKIRICTIDLAGSWQEIRDELLGLVA